MYMKQCSQFTFSYLYQLHVLKNHEFVLFFLYYDVLRVVNKSLSVLYKKNNCPIKVIILIDYIKSK